MSSMRSLQAVKAFPDSKLFLQVHIAFVIEQLIKFLVVDSVGPLDLAIEPWRSGLDVDVLDSLIPQAPLE